MNITNKSLKRRILEISFKYNLSHLGSCLTAVDIIDEIYATKKPDEPFILSSGHAGLALYAVIEKYEGVNAEQIFNHHGVHPDRCRDCHLYCSTGSLGQGLPIALGMALADKSKNVYCLISDGECAEGSIWEALRIRITAGLANLKIYVNANGYGAYDMVHIGLLSERLKWFGSVNLNVAEKINLVNTFVESDMPFLTGQEAHYHVMSQADYSIGTALLA